ncbi:MAG: protein kinase [Planctomycetota bacterium]
MTRDPRDPGTTAPGWQPTASGAPPSVRPALPPSAIAGSGSGFRGNEAPVDARQRVFGDYVIEREIGRGGMGVVWLATQRSLGRRVALKVLPNFAAMDTSAVLRFRREAEATGRITHPGIVPVYGVGEVDGIHYFAMEFIDGPPLGPILEQLSLRQAERLRGSLVEEAMLLDRYPSMREPPATGAGNRYVRSCARLCADVANALAAAHRERVIHRDLKPNNILIHPAGRPVLVDFGLARDEQNSNLTRSGEQIGTPAYMAPEQARGHRQVDTRVDIYGLGAVLYELLTLRPPFEGSNTAEIAHRILTEEPVPVRRLNPNVPVDLAAIVHRCLAKEPDGRYPVIEAVELDLRNFLAGRPVAAELPSAMARLQGKLQRHRQSLAIGASAALVATVIAVFAGVVDDRGDVNNGMAALAEARQMLVEMRDPERARDLYERAAALTKRADQVRQQRRDDFREAFRRHYPDKSAGPEMLRRFAAVFDADDRRDLRDLLDRLDGRGRLHFGSRALQLETAALEARAVTDVGLQPEWTPVRADQPIPTGEYLLRATSKDGAVAVTWAAVRADEDTRIEPRYLGADELPPDHAAVVDPLAGATIAVAQYEVTRAEWRDWLLTIEDPELREEMTPTVWGDGDDDLPVRGLSFHQARAFAAAHGAHLPTAREQWLAGSAGLQGLRMPWGGSYDRTRIAADPFQMSEPLPATSLPFGQSPLGVHHVLGNVAEVLSAFDGELRMGGGSFLDDPATLMLDGARRTVPTAPLPGIGRGHAGAGMRLYGFVAALDEPKAAAAAAERRAELRTSAVGCLFNDWTLRRDGTIDCQVELNGTYDGGQRSWYLYFDTPGYLQLAGSVRALDGHRNLLPAQALLETGAERSTLLAELPQELRRGQGYRFFLTARLQPGSGLMPVRDGYVLRLPLKRGYSVAQVYTLTLPDSCVVEEVTPPATTWSAEGRTVLSWEPTSSEQIETAVIRLRADGAFGDGLVGRRAAERRCRDFLRAWNARQGRLEGLLDPDFVRQPGSVDRARTLAHRTGETFEFVELADSVAVGDVETSEIVVDWKMRDRAGAPFELHGWRLALQWRHDGAAVRAVRMHPFTLSDQGRYDGESGYVHGRRMRVRLASVPETKLVRTQDELCELQVKLAKVESPWTTQVLGCFADANETQESIRFRLSGGASVLRPGVMLSARDTADGHEQEWLFEGEEFSRERWLFVQRGSRHLLLRFACDARDRARAIAEFEGDGAQRWFAAVLGALQID